MKRLRRRPWWMKLIRAFIIHFLPPSILLSLWIEYQSGWFFRSDPVVKETGKEIQYSSELDAFKQNTQAVAKLSDTLDTLARAISKAKGANAESKQSPTEPNQTKSSEPEVAPSERTGVEQEKTITKQELPKAGYDVTEHRTLGNRNEGNTRRHQPAPKSAKPDAPTPDEQPWPAEPTARKTPDRPAPPGVKIEVLAQLDNFLLPNWRSLQAIEEDIELVIADRTTRLSVSNTGEREASGFLYLPEGEHAYTLNSRARGKSYPENGGWFDAKIVSLSGSGQGKIRVTGGMRLTIKRDVCKQNRYQLRIAVASLDNTEEIEAEAMEAAARRRLKLAQTLRNASIEEEARFGMNQESRRLKREYRNTLEEVVKLYPKSAAAVEAEKLRWER